MPKNKSNIDNKFGVGIVITLVIVIFIVALIAMNGAGVFNASGVPANEAEVPRISLDDARKAVDEGGAVIVDVRDPASFAAAHIPGAINIPLADIESGDIDLDPNESIITYCT